MWRQGLKYFGHPLLHSQAYDQGFGLKVEQLGLETVPMWDYGAAGGNSIC